MGKSGRATRADVACLAGVAASVVSNVLSGKRRVSEVTAQKVTQAIAELGYRPDVLARSLASGKSRLLGVVVPNLDNAYFARALTGIEQVAVEHSYTVVIATTGARSMDDLALAFLDLRVDACVLLSGHGRPYTDALVAGGVAVTTCGYAVLAGQGAPIPFVRPDWASGARGSVEHLLSLGHRRIALVPGDEGCEDHRLVAWEGTLSRAGLEPAVIARGSWEYEFGQEALRAAMASGATAALVGNDYMAMGLLDAARSAGVSVPGQLSVIGFDGIWQAARLVPPLTTVCVDPEGLGRKAAEVALMCIAGATPPSVVTPVSLVVRESTGPAPA